MSEFICKVLREEYKCRFLKKWYADKYDLYIECRIYYGPFNLFYSDGFIDSDHLREVEVCHS